MSLRGQKKIFTSHDFMAVLGMAIGRLLGASRELLIILLLGVTQLADLAVLLWTLPEILVFLCTANGVNSALISRLQTENSLQVRSSIISALFLCPLLVVGLAMAAMLNLPILISLVATGLELDFQNQGFGALAMIVLFSSPLVVVASVLSAVLNSNEKYVYQGLGTAAANVGFIIGLVVGWATDHVLVFVTVGIFFGLSVRVMWLGSQIKRHSINLGSWCGFTSVQYSLLLGIVGASLSYLIFIAAPVAVRSLASTLGEGYLVMTALSIKLIQVPLMVVLNSFALVSLQKLAAAYSHDPSKVNGILKRRLRLTLGFSSAMTLIIFYGSDYLESFLPLFLPLTSHKLSFVIEFLAHASFGLPLIGLAYLLNSDFHARAEPKFLLLASCSAVSLVFFTLNLYDQMDASKLYLIWISFVLIYTSLIIIIRAWQFGFKSNAQLITGFFYALLVGFIGSL